MGFFDSILKDIADGGLEKKLEKLADSVEHLSTKLDNTADPAATKPADLSKEIDTINQKALKTIDGVRRLSS